MMLSLSGLLSYTLTTGVRDATTDGWMDGWMEMDVKKNKNKIILADHAEQIEASSSVRNVIFLCEDGVVDTLSAISCDRVFRASSVVCLLSKRRKNYNLLGWCWWSKLVRSFRRTPMLTRPLER